MIDHYFIFRFLAFRLFSATHAHVNITYVAFGLERCGNAVSLHSLVFLHTLLLRCVCFLCAAAIPSQCLNIVTFQAPTPFPPNATRFTLCVCRTQPLFSHTLSQLQISSWETTNSFAGVALNRSRCQKESLLRQE